MTIAFSPQNKYLPAADGAAIVNWLVFAVGFVDGAVTYFGCQSTAVTEIKTNHCSNFDARPPPPPHIIMDSFFYLLLIL